MSGDQNTGLGNSIINYAMTKAILDDLMLDYCLYIDGDDFIIFVEDSDVHMIQPALYTQFGMSTKLDNVARKLEHIDFCQCRPIFDGEDYTLVRNPVRMLERLQWGVGKFNTTYIRNYLTSIGMCCMSLGMGLPVEQYIGCKLTMLAGKVVRTDLTYAANMMPMRCGRAVVKEPPLATRLSYEEAWGFSIPMQRFIEGLGVSLETNTPIYPLPQYGSTTIETTEGYNVPFWSRKA